MANENEVPEVSVGDKADAEKIINALFDYLEVELPWKPFKGLILAASRQLCLSTIPYLFAFFGERGVELRRSK